MLRMLSLVSAITLAAAAYADSIRLSDPVEAGEGYEVFGAPMADKGEAQGLRELIADSGNQAGRSVRVSTAISKVCQKKGCFFIAVDGDQWARVTFKDYAFFVPTDSAQKAVTLEGVFSTRRLSAEEVAHYAADMGESGDSEAAPQIEYSIVATSVLIREGV